MDSFKFAFIITNRKKEMKNMVGSKSAGVALFDGKTLLHIAKRMAFHKLDTRY